MKRLWIDSHIHVSDIGRDQQRRAHMLDNLREVMDRSGADLRFVVSPDSPYLTAMTKDADQILPANRMVYELVRQAPDRLFGACTINPNFLEESVRAMKVCFEEWGFVMLGEMLQYMMGYKMDDAPAEQTVRLAVAYDVPVQVHLGTNWSYERPDASHGMLQMGELMRLAARVPEAQYILAHAIGASPNPRGVPWANMYLDALKHVYDEFPRNFWIEIRDFHSPALPRLLKEVPSDRILAGTDWTTRVGPPFQSYGTMFGVMEEENPFPPGVEAMVQFLRAAGAAEAEIAHIGAENAKALFKLNI